MPLLSSVSSRSYPTDFNVVLASNEDFPHSPSFPNILAVSLPNARRRCGVIEGGGDRVRTRSVENIFERADLIRLHNDGLCEDCRGIIERDTNVEHVFSLETIIVRKVRWLFFEQASEAEWITLMIGILAAGGRCRRWGLRRPGGWKYISSRTSRQDDQQNAENSDN